MKTRDRQGEIEGRRTRETARGSERARERGRERERGGEKSQELGAGEVVRRMW